MVNETESNMTQPEEFFKDFNSKVTQLYDAQRELEKVLGKAGKEIKVVPPFLCTVGANTFLGDGVHINLETFFDDKSPIYLGDRVLTGPYLKILTSNKEGVVIEDDVWIGGGVTIHPGVRIKKGAVISAGSHVTDDVAENALVVGSPARKIREIDQTELPEGRQSNSGETEKQKMTHEKIFFSSDPQLKEDKQKAYEFFRDFNSRNAQISPQEKTRKLRGIFGEVGENLDVHKLYFSYGYQIFIGNDVRLGERIFLGDAGKIVIGNNVTLGPEVQLYTTNHCLPIPYRGYIIAKDIVIENDAQIGQGAIILPGVRIGEGAQVLEYSVVNRNVLPHTKVGGIPAKIVSENL